MWRYVSHESIARASWHRLTNWVYIHIISMALVLNQLKLTEIDWFDSLSFRSCQIFTLAHRKRRHQQQQKKFIRKCRIYHLICLSAIFARRYFSHITFVVAATTYVCVCVCVCDSLCEWLLGPWSEYSRCEWMASDKMSFKHSYGKYEVTLDQVRETTKSQNWPRKCLKWREKHTHTHTHTVHKEIMRLFAEKEKNAENSRWFLSCALNGLSTMDSIYGRLYLSIYSHDTHYE